MKVGDVGRAVVATALSLSVLALLPGCGGKSGDDNVSEVQMKDIENADGTINDAMTDLDGVQSEGTAIAANDAAANASAPAAAKADGGKEPPAPEENEEVVADQ
ncbi:MAG: hypothetical protein AB7U35_01995 [Sphingobium sp.]